MVKGLIGRDKEHSRLLAHAKSSKSEFVAVYGRRRVGKTYLIRETFGQDFAFYFTGLADVDMPTQLTQFHVALQTYGQSIGFAPSQAGDWFQAFAQLKEYIEHLDRHGGGTDKKVIFLDELPWMDTPRSKFLSGIEHFWNSWASARKDILLIVCGSAASWMIKNLIKNKGGLHNRITDHIRLHPFTLNETEQMLEQNGLILDRYQTTILYMAFGGIPFYIDRIKKGKSAMQNINDLCFGKDAPFRFEFNMLFASLFNKHERHMTIVKALAAKGKGLSRSEIIAATKMSDGGGISRLLDELEESNFIRKYKFFGRRAYTYQLIDLFSLFYLRFMQESDMTDELYWTNKVDTPSFYTWAGLAFEKVCLQHVPQIKHALGISGVQTSVSTWQSAEAQIDLVIDRKDHVINLCEMKFSIHPFTIDKKYAANLTNKMTTFRAATKTRKSLFLTMVSTYGATNNTYWGMIQNEITIDALFVR